MDWLPESNETKQGSPAWHAWRSKGLGSSDAATLLGINPYKTLSKLFLEKTGKAEPFKGNFHTERGQRLEETVRALNWRDFIPEIRVHKDYEFIRASCDGYKASTRELIEIKCPYKEPHEFVPVHYLAQCQWMLMVFECETLHFISYVEDVGMKVHVVTPDKVMQNLLIEKAIWFWDLIQRNESPEPKNLSAIVQEYSRLKEKRDHLNIELDDLKNKMKALVTTKSEDVSGHRLQWIERKGTVDYNKVPELEGVDLEPYRKEATLSFDIREIK